MGSVAATRNRLTGIALSLCLCCGIAQALDWERGFRNYDRVEAGEITEQALSPEERNELQVIRNTLEQFEAAVPDADIQVLDCHALRQARRHQGQLLAGDAMQLASCARRHDQPSLAALASRLGTCAGSAAQGGLQDCNSLIASIRARRGASCTHEIRSTEQSQRRLTSLRLRTAEVCDLPE